ncbi:MAG: nitroreductase family protein [bacterium]|nr:nitroreductase family protein [bacterium]MDZ4341440.1 nitroreductase family protein [Candidatus Binatia bacterium]
MTSHQIIEQILPAAVLAPSAHNTQPWLFNISDNTIDIYIDHRRHLMVSDPTHRQLYTSLGCLIANCLIAAAHHNHHTDIDFFPDGEGENMLIARLRLNNSGTDSHLASLFPVINQRRTDRSEYNKEPLTADEKNHLPSLQSLAVIPVETHEQIDKLAAITGAGSYATLARKDFRRELSHWVRSNWTRQPDGMPGYAMLIPAPLTPVLPWAVLILPIHKQEQTNTAKQIASASTIAVFATSADSPQDWLRVGIDMETLWLEATKAGLAAAPMAAAIEAGDKYRHQTQQILGTNLLPHAILRIGHSLRHNLKATPRRTARDCLRK